MMTPDKKNYLPDFCSAETLLKLIIVIEFAAIVFAILTIPDFRQIYSQMGLISVFMLLIVFSSVAILCLFKKRILLLNHTQTTVVTIGVFTAFTAIITIGILSLDWFTKLFKVSTNELWFIVAKFEIIAIIGIGIGLRYLYIKFEEQQIIEIQNNARLDALHARIRPHFLFNSMNTIASLVHDAPDTAELAIERLSHLFRASLRDQIYISLNEELQHTKDYVALEKLRLEERLNIEWDLDTFKSSCLIPPLTLQPLVENAIYHGIEPRSEGGTIFISAKQIKQTIEIKIENPVWSHENKKQGNQMALNNIQERLKIAYKGRSDFKSQLLDDCFKVCFKIPVKTS